MPDASRTLRDAAAAVARRIDNARTVHVDQAAAQGLGQHAARTAEAEDNPTGRSAEQG